MLPLLRPTIAMLVTIAILVTKRKEKMGRRIKGTLDYKRNASMTKNEDGKFINFKTNEDGRLSS